MRTEYLNPNLYPSLYDLMQYENVLAMRLSLETGLRIDDVLSLKWKNFKSSQRFSFVAKKTKKRGTKRISKALAAQLWSRDTKSEYVFPGRKAGSHRTRQTVWKDVKQAADRLGVEVNVAPHSARKTYAVELRKAEGLPAVQRELQHTNKETSMLYAFADERAGKWSGALTVSDLKRIAAELAKLLLPEIRALIREAAKA